MHAAAVTVTVVGFILSLCMSNGTGRDVVKAVTALALFIAVVFR